MRLSRRLHFRRSRKGSPAVPLLFTCFLSIALLGLFSARLRPVIETMAVSKATNLITLSLADAVADGLAETSYTYHDFISAQTDAEGRIVSLNGNPNQSSQFKRAVIRHLTAQIEELSSEQLGIPLGTLTGKVILADVGPEVRVRIQAVGDVTATYSHRFTSAGVNQTLHGIYLELTATVHLLIPGQVIPVAVKDSVCIAESLIVGEVPSTYIHMEKGDD